MDTDRWLGIHAYRVELVVLEAVVLEEDAGVGVDVGVGVLGLAVLGQHAGHHLVHSVDDLRAKKGTMIGG